MTDFNAEILLQIQTKDIEEADALAEQIAGEIKSRHGVDGYAVIAGIEGTVMNVSVEAVAEKRERRIR